MFYHDQIAMYLTHPLLGRAQRLAIILIVYALLGAFALCPSELGAQTNRNPVEIDLGTTAPDEPYLAIIASLGEAGFLIEQVNRTWLNRIRIIAVNDQIRREIVISQSTGQILRDVAYAR